MSIDPQKIREIILDSLYRNEEVEGRNSPPPDALIGDGIVNMMAFHPERLRAHEPEIKAMLLLLDDSFMLSKGGGMSFLNMPFDKFGNQWGEQPNAGELVALGTALDLIKIPLDREDWPMLPGGVPYIMVVDNEKALKEE